MTTRILQLARDASALSLDDAPDDVRVRLRMQALSVLGASAAGTRAPDVEPVLGVAARSPGPLPTVPGVPLLSLDAALRVAPALSVAMDYDDYLLCGHTGHTAVWASWLGGAALGRDGDEIERAQLAANEILGRLGGFVLAGPQNGQSWAFLHALGAALTGGLLMRLDPDRLAHALAIALSRAPFVDWRTFHTGSKVLLAGEAAANGWRAAELAAAGLDGPLDLLEDGSDLVRVLCDGRPLAGWLTGVGRAWLTQTLTFKMVPGCAYLGSAVEATAELVGELGQAEVLRVDVDGPIVTAAMERLLGGTDLGTLQPVAVNFSVARSLAVLLTRGHLGPKDLTLEALAEVERVGGDLAQRIHVHHDWRMTLALWDALKAGIGAHRLFAGLGPSALVAAAARVRRQSGAASDADGVGARGWPGMGTGLAWSELPVALAQERLGDLEGWVERVERTELASPSDLLERGLERVADRAGRWVSRGIDRVLGGRGGGGGGDGERRRDRRFDLGRYDLRGVGLPLPARVKVLAHGGRVLTAERDGVRGSPLRPDDEVTADVRTKFVRSSELTTTNRAGRLEAVADALLTPAGGVPPLPAGGPAELLTRWAAG